MLSDYVAWWLRCGDVAAVIDDEPLTFEWDNGTSGGFSFGGQRVLWNHSSDSSMGPLESIVGDAIGPKIRDAIRKLVGPGFYPVEFTPNETELLNKAVAELHAGHGWTTGRRLRALLGDWERDRFDRVMARLRPRYFARIEGVDMEFCPRIPALFKSPEKHAVEHIILKTVELLRTRYAKNADVEGYNIDEVLAVAGLGTEERSFVDNVLSISGLAFPNPHPMTHALGSRRAPHADDVETFRKCTTLRDYVLATSKNGESARPWPTAPVDLLRGHLSIRDKGRVGVAHTGIASAAQQVVVASHAVPVNQDMQKPKTILFLAANPMTDRLALDEEARDIEAKIQTSPHRDSLILKTRWAVRPDDLLQALNQDRPTIVHFSGHGSGAAGIVLHFEGGATKLVGAAALRHLFETLKGDIRVLVLNACYSVEQATAIVSVIDCVVGMKDSVGDDAARAFAASFYRALGFGRSVKNAFDQGVAAIKLNGLGDEDVPILLVREGVNADGVILVGDFG